MGKKNKESKSNNEEPAVTSATTAAAADDDALIPYHTKQASFALLYLLFFSILMFTLPFAAFYGTRHALHEYFNIDGFTNTCWSVLASVVTVNIVIALYAICGYLDAKKEEETVNQHALYKEKNN